MDHVATNIHGQITSNGAGLGLQRLCGTNQLAGTGDHAVAFPNHGNHRTRRDEAHQTSEERTLFMNAVVLLREGTTGGDLLQAHQLESLALKTTQDLADQAALDTIRLNGDESAFSHGEEQQ